LRVLVLLGSILVLTACTPGFIHNHPGEAAARVGYVSTPVNSSIPIDLLAFSKAGEAKTIPMVGKKADSILQLVQPFADLEHQQPRQMIDLSLTPYGGARAEEYLIEKPEEWKFPTSKSPSRSIPELRKNVTPDMLALREGNQWRLLPFRNNPALTRFCSVSAQMGMRRGGGISFQDLASVTVRKIYSTDRSKDRYLIMRLIPPVELFPVGTLSHFPGEQYFQISVPARSVPETVKSLPPGEDFVIVWGTGTNQAYCPHSTAPAATFGTSPGTASIVAQNGDNSTTREANAPDIIPFERQGSTKDLVFSWLEASSLCMVIYGSRAPPFL